VFSKRKVKKQAKPNARKIKAKAGPKAKIGENQKAPPKAQSEIQQFVPLDVLPPPKRPRQKPPAAVFVPLPARACSTAAKASHVAARNRKRADERDIADVMGGSSGAAR
jgi:hypothetical protein